MISERDYCTVGYGLDYHYDGPKRITEVNSAHAAAAKEIDSILESVPEALKKTAAYHLRHAHDSYPQYSFNYPLSLPDTKQYEEIDKLSEVRAIGGSQEWMLKNTRYRHVEKTDVMLIDALPAVAAIKGKSFIEVVQPHQCLAFFKDKGKIESKAVDILYYALPFLLEPPIKEMDEELAVVIRDEIIFQKLTHVHGVLISRPVIYQLVAPWSRVVVFGAKSRIPTDSLFFTDTQP